MSRKDDFDKTRPSIKGKKKANALRSSQGFSGKVIGKHGRAGGSSASSETKHLDFAELVAVRQAARDLENERMTQRARVEDALSSTSSMEAIVEEITEDALEDVIVEEDSNQAGMLDEAMNEADASSIETGFAESDSSGDDNASLDEGLLSAAEPPRESEESTIQKSESDLRSDDDSRARRSKVSVRQKRRAEKKAADARETYEKKKREKLEAKNLRSEAEKTVDGAQPHSEGREQGDLSQKEKKPISPALKRRRRRGIIFLATILLIAVIAAVCVAFFTFSSNINNKIALKDDDLGVVLVPSEDKEEPYYVMVEVEYDKTSRYYEGPGMVELLRVDPANHVVTAISVPSNTTVPLSDGEYHSISEAQPMDGDAYMTSIVSKLFNVNIAHVIRMDAEGLQHIIDYFGGIQVNVPEVVDDPDAGDVYIDAGTQTLDGAAVVVMTRADNFNDPVSTRAANQNAVIEQLVKQAIAQSDSGYAKAVDTLKNDFKTDMKASELKRLLKTLSSEEGITFYSACVPGDLDVETQGKVFYASKKELSQMVDAMERDGNPDEVDESFVDKQSIFIEVRNGSGIDGGAVQVRTILQNDDWKVSFTSNADSSEYGETLVVYNDEENKSVAEALVKSLGIGRVIEANENYEFGTDLLVIVGRDWKPRS